MFIIYLVKIIDFVLKNISVSTILHVITQCTTVLNVQDLTLLYRVLKSYAKLANGGIFFGWLCEIFSIVLVSFMLTTLSEFCVNSIQWFFFLFFYYLFSILLISKSTCASSLLLRPVLILESSFPKTIFNRLHPWELMLKYYS